VVRSFLPSSLPGLSLLMEALRLSTGCLRYHDHEVWVEGQESETVAAAAMRSRRQKRTYSYSYPYRYSEAQPFKL
jgi:hypothetical protein